MDAGEEPKLTGAADKGPQASDEGALFNNKRCKKDKEGPWKKTFKSGLSSAVTKNGKIDSTVCNHLKKHLEKKELMEMIEKLQKESGDISDEDQQKLRKLLIEHEADKKRGKDKIQDLGQEKVWYRYVAGVVLAFALLVLWVGTTVFFLYNIFDSKCNGLKPIDKGINATEIEKHKICEELFASSLGTVHNITFGLITAVVISQLGETSEDSGLYKSFEPVRNQQKAKLRAISLEGSHHGRMWYSCEVFLSSIFELLIIYSTRFYIILWIVVGFVCLICGAYLSEFRSGPIYTTGQTWLGISITMTYTYFGINKKSDDDKKTDKKTDENAGDNAISKLRKNSVPLGDDASSNTPVDNTPV